MSEPLRVLSLGAGVQSSTVLLMSCVGELPKLDACVFADTQWEPPAVYEHLDYLTGIAATHGIPVHRVTAGNLREWALHPYITPRGQAQDRLPYHTLRSGKPGLANRMCTFEFKIKPIQQHLRTLAGLKKGQRCAEVRVEQWIGISRDEAQRMKPAGFAWIRNHYPLVEAGMRRNDCLRWIEAHGFKRPPRSACIGCPFHNDREWREIKADPAQWADAVEFERHIRVQQPAVFLHPQRVPLDQVDLSTAEERGQISLFGNECAGICGV